MVDGSVWVSGLISAAPTITAVFLLLAAFAKYIRGKTKDAINELAVPASRYEKDQVTIWGVIEELRKNQTEFAVIKERLATVQDAVKKNDDTTERLRVEIREGFNGIFKEMRGEARH
jgi:hypothetical protein